jgi:hypothetical protein
VAQLVSAPPCHGGGRGFESRQGRQHGEAHAAFRSRPGSSVGMSVRLKSGRSPVRSRPWPPGLAQFNAHMLCRRTAHHRTGLRDGAKMEPKRCAAIGTSSQVARLRSSRESSAAAMLSSSSSNRSAYVWAVTVMDPCPIAFCNSRRSAPARRVPPVADEERPRRHTSAAAVPVACPQRNKKAPRQFLVQSWPCDF